VLSLLPEKIRATVITNDETLYKIESWEKVHKVISHLEENNIQVICKSQVYQRYAVIDRQTVWYGGINFLGFERADNGVMRLCSTELAKELLNIVDCTYNPEQLALPKG